VLAVVAARTILELSFAGRYGWHRDELYYAVAGRHLQGGYVEFPPVTAVLSAVAHALFGWSLTGFRLFPILAGAGVTVLASLVARELGGGGRAQLLAAVLVGLSPILFATNGLFQPVSFDQLTTMALLWLALRLALGRGSWPAIGVVTGIGLETKYTLAVVLVLLLAGFLAWRRDLLFSRGLVLAAGIAALVMIPNLLWEASHDWVSVHWFLHPPPSASDESRPGYVVNLVLETSPIAFPVAVAGMVSLLRDRRVRPLGLAAAATPVAYFLLGGKSYYAAPAMLFAVAAGAPPLERWLTRPRAWTLGIAFGVSFLVFLPLEMPVLPLHTADRAGIIAGRSDFEAELAWPTLVRDVERHATGTDVVLASNYGEAGALDLFGHGLPPVATADVTFRYWRPPVHGRRALLVGFSSPPAGICRGFHVLTRFRLDLHNDEQGAALARCTLVRPLGEAWPALVATYPG
jgi:hypothetical protein